MLSKASWSLSVSLSVVVSVSVALSESFPIYDVYAATGGDLIVVAATGRRIPEVTSPVWEDAGPGLLAALDRAEIRTRQDVAVRKAGNQATFGVLPGVFGAEANSDFHPVIEENPYVTSGGNWLAPFSRRCRLFAGGAVPTSRRSSRRSRGRREDAARSRWRGAREQPDRLSDFERGPGVSTACRRA